MQPNKISEVNAGGATSVPNAGALGRKHRSVLALGLLRAL